ncbi:lipid IV(A) 3-deoxy-D-manno-octulosonic acid transferase [Nitratifractor salsuginis]|uniref:3-deoxy-D-manno-octulosonic acid transferase n=1 Tax=Nitratifractor salsuginis (strain DSM 16511 / JCM 12458 / E9I37-1) TaxID=749222 RepID=E6X1V9_NITSE|nr:lipid IV(A) 3-deoxy-D-manno-octulosonic acid transferase [Nitratifractor salsuginis]ADV45967.1 Three-deoxy-D-manno-octulosonic-acid transferase domain-containing protein [Nitratifractor salsuginis DSM 16511]
MFTCCYTLLSAILWLAALPFLLLFSFKKKYRRSIPARFFLWKNPPLREGGIWFHVCSFGEARGVAPLVERFAPELRRMSATTQTGFESIASLAPEQSRYLPFEPLLWLWVKPQKALVVMEAELWYLLFTVAKRRGAPTFLINARISDRSWPGYRRFAWFYRRIFARIDRIFAQSEKDRERLEALGARNVEVTGNIKLAQRPQPTRQLPKPEGYLVCAASTHEGEEGAVLEAFRELKALRPEAKLLVVPRHPERFDKVWRMMESFAKLQAWQARRFSQGESLEADLILMDRMGELINCYAISDLVVLGGAFEPIGGHNAVEAAQFGMPIISGPHYFNQEELFAGIEGITIAPKEELAEVLRYPKLLEPTRLKVRGDALERIEKEIRNVL